MAWLFVVQGMSVTVTGGYQVEDIIESSVAFKELARESESRGLVLKTQVSDEDTVAIFLGKELLPSRHLYVGQTQVGEQVKEEWGDLNEKLEKLFPQLGFDILKIEKGVVVSQFD